MSSSESASIDHDQPSSTTNEKDVTTTKAAMNETAGGDNAKESKKKKKTKTTRWTFSKTWTVRVAFIMTIPYILGRFGFGFLWLFALVGIAGTMLRTQERKWKSLYAARAIHGKDGGSAQLNAVLESLPSWVRYPDTDRAEYINKTIALLWPHVNQAVGTIVMKQVNATLEKFKPSVLSTFEITKFDLGSCCPIVKGIRAYERTGIGSGALDVEIQYVTSTTAAIVLTISRGIITMTVKVSNIIFSAVSRVEIMSVGGDLPCFDALGISLVRPPKVDFSVEALACDLTLLPGVEGMIHSTIKDALEGTLVWPRRIIVPAKRGVDVKELSKSGSEHHMDAVAILSVKLIEAASLKQTAGEDFLEKIQFKKSVPDPYVVLELRKTKHTSRVIHNNVDPQYEETFAFNLYDSKDELVLHVYDFDRISEDEPIGFCTISMSDFDVMKAENVDKWFDLKAGTKDSEPVLLESHDSDVIQSTVGRVHLQMRFLPLKGHSQEDDSSDDEAEEEKIPGDDDGKEQLSASGLRRRSRPRAASSFDMGNLEITVHRAIKLHKGGFLSGGVDAYVKVRVEGQFRKTAIVKNETDPVWDEKYSFVIEDGHKAVLDISVKDVDMFTKKEVGSYKIGLESFLKQTLPKGGQRIKLPLMKGTRPSGHLEVSVKWRGIQKATSV